MATYNYAYWCNSDFEFILGSYLVSTPDFNLQCNRESNTICSHIIIYKRHILVADCIVVQADIYISSLTYAPIESLKHDSTEQTTVLDNPVYGVIGPQSEVDERELDNPIYGMQDEDPVEEGYETPHFDTMYSSL